MDNKGSTVVELCLIAPILVCTVFVVINMLILTMNYSIGTGEAYTVLYSREEYMVDGGEDRAAEEAESMDGDIEADMQGMLIYAGNVCAKSEFVSGSGGGAGLLAGGASGEFMASISYEQTVPGMFAFDASGRMTKNVEAREEVRNVGSNLRRWQIYGELLSDRGN